MPAPLGLSVNSPAIHSLMADDFEVLEHASMSSGEHVGTMVDAQTLEGMIAVEHGASNDDSDGEGLHHGSESVEELIAMDTGNEQTDEENHFDRVVGALEDILMEEEFASVQTQFCRQHCHVFRGDRSENRLEYMDLFQAYQDLVESFLERRLTSLLEGFDMAEFLATLTSRCSNTLRGDQGEGDDKLQGEVFDVLFSLTDYVCFKELMWTYADEAAEVMENGVEISRQQTWGLRCGGVAIHTDEQEDGDARPDLDDLFLQTSPIRVVNGSTFGGA